MIDLVTVAADPHYQPPRTQLILSELFRLTGSTTSVRYVAKLGFGGSVASITRPKPSEMGSRAPSFGVRKFAGDTVTQVDNGGKYKKGNSRSRANRTV